MARKSKKTAAPQRSKKSRKNQGEQKHLREKPEPQQSNLPEDDVVEASMESFPAGDAPAWTRREREMHSEERE